MARLARTEVFAPDEVAVVQVMNRVVRRCFLLGDDPVTGKNYDHRKLWIEDLLKRFSAAFGPARRHTTNLETDLRALIARSADVVFVGGIVRSAVL